ncbi:MAG: 4-hydroxy-tetrahydrodipicolinate reductase [Acidimicrobiales bacterium]
MTRVGVFGAGGRMGSTVCQAVDDAADLQLVAAVDPHHAGIDLRQVAPAVIEDLPIAGSAQEMIDQGVEVAVDFTEVGAARSNLAFMAEHAIHAVVGTTGFHRADLAALEAAFVNSNCLVAPNFAIGAVLMMRFAEMAAPYFETAEVIELHHDQKLDAPSGTAMLTAERMAGASDDWADDPTENEVVPGARGGPGPAGIHVHSVRLRGLVAHQEVLLGTTGQTLSIRHDSIDRSSFMPGVLLGIRKIAEHPGVTISLDPFLDLNAR